MVIPEEQGIKAIIYLQSMSGVVETVEQARAGWCGMSESEKETTMHVYERYGPGDDNDGNN